MNKLYYLATPYSKWATGLQNAYVETARLAARLLESGVNVYSPIVHTHPIAIYGNIDPYNHDIWLPVDNLMMEKLDGLLIATFPGWEQSKGVKHEVEFFAKRGIAPMFLDPETLRIS